MTEPTDPSAARDSDRNSGTESPPQAEALAGIPWIDAEIQQKVAWRDGDIVVSVPGKSGTTWTMNIVHQLRTGGDPEFLDIYREVPWLEFVDRPDRSRDQLVQRIDDMPHDRRRAFKTHSAPPILPFIRTRAGQDPDVRYVIVLRNPDEALVSMKPFIEKHTQAFFDLWQVPREQLTRPDFASFYRDIVIPNAMYAMWFGFMAEWWPLRHEPNVLFIHFADMKRHHEVSIRTIAEFLGFEPDAEQWPAILEYTSFAWMKRHQRKFELPLMSEVPMLESGAMVRAGRLGAAPEDGMTDDIARDLAARGRELLRDPVAFEWLYHGGPLPR